MLCIYLLHFPLLRLAWQYLLFPFHLTAWMNFALLGAIAGPIIIGLCYLFFLVGERPFLSRRPGATLGAAVQ